MTETLNLAASICTGLIWGSSIALVVILGAMGTVFEMGRRAGRNGERARWEYIWPDSPVDDAFDRVGIRR